MALRAHLLLTWVLVSVLMLHSVSAATKSASSSANIGGRQQNSWLQWFVSWFGDYAIMSNQKLTTRKPSKSVHTKLTIPDKYREMFDNYGNYHDTYNDALNNDDYYYHQHKVPESSQQQHYPKRYPEMFAHRQKPFNFMKAKLPFRHITGGKQQYYTNNFIFGKPFKPHNDGPHQPQTAHHSSSYQARPYSHNVAQHNKGLHKTKGKSRKEYSLLRWS